MDSEQLCREVRALACEVGDYLVSERRRIGSVDSEAKGLHDYVTRFDKESERRIVESLRQLLPEGGFIAEEGTASASGRERYTWIIDPIDGTTNFIHGLQPTCISIALQDNLLSSESGRPVFVLGVVNEIWAKECFYAFSDSDGAFLNDEQIHVSQSRTLNDSLIATGFPYTNLHVCLSICVCWNGPCAILMVYAVWVLQLLIWFIRHVDVLTPFTNMD